MAQTSRQYDFQDGNKLTAQQLDDEFDTLVNAHNTLDGELITHKTSADHDGRYYTKTETDQEINNAIVNLEGTNIVDTGTAFPATPTEGQTFYNTNEDQLYVYNGSTWDKATDLTSTTNRLDNQEILLMWGGY